MLQLTSDNTYSDIIIVITIYILLRSVWIYPQWLFCTAEVERILIFIGIWTVRTKWFIIEASFIWIPLYKVSLLNTKSFHMNLEYDYDVEKSDERVSVVFSNLYAQVRCQTVICSSIYLLILSISTTMKENWKGKKRSEH